MGSGAFLVAACRYLASGYEAALVREGSLGPSDVSESRSRGFPACGRAAVFVRRGHESDGRAAGRLSLWLATLAADKPLTFLDHRLRVGNSLIGASIDDLGQEPGPGAMQKPRDLPLFRERSCSSPCARPLASVEASPRCPMTVSSRSAPRSESSRRSIAPADRSRMARVCRPVVRRLARRARPREGPLPRSATT